VLVWHDLLGISDGHRPRFVKAYADLRSSIADALSRYAAEVRAGTFPATEHTYRMPDAERDIFEGEASTVGPERRKPAR
jgi:3-methyl-2-oxobutanoate hydroxymethyltransferase